MGNGNVVVLGVTFLKLEKVMDNLEIDGSCILAKDPKTGKLYALELNYYETVETSEKLDEIYHDVMKYHQRIGK